MKNETPFAKLLKSVSRFLVIFLLVSFLITCCVMLFVSELSKTVEVDFGREELNTAAKLTFLNVILLSLLLTCFDLIRKKVTVKLPAKKITDAAEKIMHGDFSARISSSVDVFDGFGEIADCFNAMAKELSGMETLRSDFIANVSHELKTPLAVIGNYATLLRRPELSEEKRIEYSESIGEASRCLADLITDILRLNKLENQQIFPKSECYDLGEQLCECLLSYEDIWENKCIDIVTNIEDGVFVRSDPEMMSIVWNNLFSNALKFTDNGGRVSVAVRAEGTKAIVQISDTGCGISGDVGAHIFDKFYQGDTSHTTQGNGLGLALVKRVIDITGSEISVESELLKGSTFTVKMEREYAEATFE